MIFCPRCKRQVEHSDSFYLPGPLCSDCRMEEIIEMSDEELVKAAEEVIAGLMPWPRSRSIVTEILKRWKQVQQDYRRQQ
jgi:hypothetical protein